MKLHRLCPVCQGEFIEKGICELCRAERMKSKKWIKRLLEEFREFAIEDYRNQHHTCYPIVDEFLKKSKVWNDT